MAQSVNTFNELNSDSHSINTSNVVMTDALNATLTTKGENQLILQNMTGNKDITGLTEGFQPLGVEVYNGISYIVSGRFDDDGNFLEGEIGTFPSPRWGSLITNGLDPDYFLTLNNEYAPLHNFYSGNNLSLLDNDIHHREPFRTSKFNFLSDRLIEVECQPSYDGSVNIILTDDYNHPRLINSRFKLSDDAKSAAIADRRQDKDTNTYSNERWLSTRLLKVSDKILDLTFNGVANGGNLISGGYVFYFRYENSDGAQTDIVEQSRPVMISHDNYGARPDESTGKSVKFTLNNLDRSYSTVRVSYSQSNSAEVAGSTTIKQIENLYDITGGPGDPIEIIITGYETTTDLTSSVLNLNYSSIDTVKTISQHDDRLVLGNISQNINDYEEFVELSQKIRIFEGSKIMQIALEGSGYADPMNVYENLGYWSGESYEIGIVYILPNGGGLTPVFPVRGLDNYLGNKSYTGSTVINEDNGYKGLTSENRLGAYRTSKDRKMINGLGETEVKYLQANMSAMSTRAAEISDGYFFVRRERKRDAIIQGYFCNANAVDMSTKNIQDEASNNNQNYYSIANRGSGDDDLQFDYDHYRFMRDSNGVTSDRVKYMPAPGRIWTTTVIDRANSGGTILTNEKGDSFNALGKVAPDVSGVNTDAHYTFYSADMLCDSPSAASYFSGSQKGISLNDHGNVIMMEETIVPGLPTNNTPTLKTYASNSGLNGGQLGNWVGSRFIRIHQSHFVLSEVADINGNITGLQGFIQLIVERVNIGGTSTNKTYSVQFDVLIDITTGIISGTANPTPSTTNNVFTGSEGDHEAYDGGSPSSIYGQVSNPTDLTNSTLAIYQVSLVTENGNNDYNIVPAFHTTNNTHDILSNLETSSVDVSFSTATLHIPVSEVDPIKVLTIREFDFKPITVDSTYKIRPTYVNSGRSGYSHNSFASVAKNNLYSFLGNSQIAGVDQPTRTSPTLITTSTSNFEDFVGIKQGVNHPVLKSQLFNDSINVFNDSLFPSNSYGYAGSDLGDYVTRVQIDGIRFAVLSNIYNSINGVIPDSTISGDWKSIYNNNSVGNPYFPITKRLPWSSLPTNRVMDLFGGDCYLSHTYKRVVKPLGIEGVPTASDPDTYEDSNADAGLAPKGFVFPLVNESNHNPALRTTDNSSQTETNLYGKDRDFYPLTNIDDIRASQQSESKSYNFGYEILGDKFNVGLNDRSPIFNTYLPNRVQVSSPSLSGAFQNGYTDFSGLNFRDYNAQLGEITRLISHNNQLYCIFEKGIGIVPMNQRTMIPSETGEINLDDAQVLSQKMQLISSEYGSDQQFSVKKTDGYIYGVDLRKNKVWRIEGNQVNIISDFAVQSILNIYKNRLSNNPMSDFVKTNYDRERNNVIFSFYNLENGTFTTDLYTSTFVESEPGGDLDDTIVIDEVINTPTSTSRSFIPSGTSTRATGLDGGPTREEAAKIGTINVSDINNNDTDSTVDGGPTRQEASKVGSISGEIIPDTSFSIDGGPTRAELSKIPGITGVNAVDFIKTRNSNQDDTISDITALTREFDVIDEVGQGKGDVVLPSGDVVELPQDAVTGEYLPLLQEEGLLGSIYFNETINKWVSQLSWNPIFTWNLGNKLYSFNGLNKENIDPVWEHFSPEVPYCNFYGRQDKFEFEFVIVDNPSAQKILNNFIIICNQVYPGRIVYNLESDRDYDNLLVHSDNNIDLIKQRHEYIENDPTQLVHWTMIPSVIGGLAYMSFNISKEEAERIKGAHFVYSNNFYILGDYIEQAGVVYVQILDAQGNPLPSLPAGIQFNRLEYGLIKQNIEYKEDHMYVEVGKALEKSRVRDKTIKVRVVYEGHYHTVVQSIISLFLYSYN